MVANHHLRWGRRLRLCYLAEMVLIRKGRIVCLAGLKLETWDTRPLAPACGVLQQTCAWVRRPLSTALGRFGPIY